MSGEHLKVHARRVVAGVDDKQRSFVESDADTPSRVALDAFTINQIWQVDSVPPHVLADDTSAGQVSIAPPGAGFVYLLTTFPPDSEWDLAAGYQEALAASGDGKAFRGGEDETPGMHQTDTVDIITVVDGELYAVLEEGEVLLRPGESFVQRGTKHTWSNRSARPATIVAVMMGATR